MAAVWKDELGVPASLGAGSPTPWTYLFSDNLELSENSDYNCLSGKELANSLPDKLKSMEYIYAQFLTMQSGGIAAKSTG
jgi:hypothetical protein